MSDTISLTKGENIDLTKAEPELKKLIAGAGWDAKPGKSIDLDLMAILLGTDGKALPDANSNGSNVDEALVFFNHKELAGLKHSGDNTTGEGEGDDERIVITLADVPEAAKAIAIIVVSYSGEKFSEIENVSTRMVNAEGNKELAKFELKDGLGDTKAVEMGKLERVEGGWKFTATGSILSGEWKDAVKSYGVTV